MRKQLSSFLNGGLRFAAITVAAFVFVFNIFYHATVSYNNKETVTIHSAFGTGAVSLAVICAVILGLILLRKYMEDLQEERLFRFFVRRLLRGGAVFYSEC